MMKARLISAIIVLLLIIPIIIIGGTIFHVALFIISLLALKEFLESKNNKKEIPLLIKIICYLIMTLFMFNSTNLINIDMRILIGVIISLLLPLILYHDEKKYSCEDAFYLLGGLVFLLIAFKSLFFVRSLGISYLIYIMLITIITDTYAFITGLLIGSHKLVENISPKKTWEGLIGGTIFGVGISSVFYITVINPGIPLTHILMISLFLSLLGQFGDLIFSSIKRFYKIKDFSNIMPGHGGILDRLDSIILVSIGFMLISSLI